PHRVRPAGGALRHRCGAHRGAAGAPTVPRAGARPIASTTVVIVSYLVFGRLAAGMQNNPEQLSDAALAWLAWGTTAGVAVMSLPMLVPVWRCGVRLRPTLRFPPGVARRAGALAMAGLGTLVAQQLSVIVVVWLSRAG